MRIRDMIPEHLNCKRIYFPVPQVIYEAILYLTVRKMYATLCTFRDQFQEIGFVFPYAGMDDDGDDGETDLSILDYEAAQVREVY